MRAVADHVVDTVVAGAGLPRGFERAPGSPRGYYGSSDTAGIAGDHTNVLYSAKPDLASYTAASTLK
jgi:hypothetical protein